MKTIWIDLENSPHVPFFRPILPELRERGYELILTARDCFQVCELADMYGLEYQAIGRHYGKNKAAKVAGIMFRCTQLAPLVFEKKPVLALSHGSRTMMLLAAALGVPSLTIFDYEHSSKMVLPGQAWWMVPEVIPESSLAAYDSRRMLRYEGIKEDVYAPSFRPDPAIREELGIAPEDLVVTVRPPATEAHYHNPESEKLLDAAVRLVTGHPQGKIVLLPRSDKQTAEYHQRWAALFANGKLMIPERVVDGMNLVWFSDLVISGGGTMNREAAALGVPVYSIFRGPIGSVDQYLERTGRMTLLTSVEEVEKRILLARRERPAHPNGNGEKCLQTIVTNIETVLHRTNGR